MIGVGFHVESHIALVVVHHTNKGKDESDPFMQISGTNGIFGVADTILLLERKQRNDDQAILHITGRDVESNGLALVRNRSACRWEVLGDVAEIAEQEKAKQEQERKLQQRADYENDYLVKVIKSLMTPSGGWRGQVQDIKTEGAFEDSPQALGRKLSLLVPMLYEYDRIIYDQGRPGGKIIHSFKYESS